ncbi:hypothetical protein GCM10010300_49260 [Streptomyces olivaceoviridis]|nr:hypothetical protein GCM10010300_49260 [Streptomyces olivaceoviridis]
MRIRGLDKYYGATQVLHGVDLDVAAGEMVAITGPSGSGKSTLCRCVNRLESATVGTVTLDGVPLPAEGRELSRLRAEVGMVFQSFNLFAHLTVMQNLMLAPVKVRDGPRRRAPPHARLSPTAPPCSQPRLGGSALPGAGRLKMARAGVPWPSEPDST